MYLNMLSLLSIMETLYPTKFWPKYILHTNVCSDISNLFVLCRSILPKTSYSSVKEVDPETKATAEPTNLLSVASGSDKL